MGANLLILWSQLFDIDQCAFLRVVANGMLMSELCAGFLVLIVRMAPDPHLVGVAALLQASIVKLSAPIKCPLQFFGCCCIRVDAIFESLDAHRTLFLRYLGHQTRG